MYSTPTDANVLVLLTVIVLSSESVDAARIVSPSQIFLNTSIPSVSSASGGTRIVSLPPKPNGSNGLIASSFSRST